MKVVAILLMLLGLLPAGSPVNQGAPALPGRILFLGPEQVTVWQGGRQEVIPLPAGLVAPQVAPDGRHLAGVLDRELMVLPLVGGERERLGDVPGRSPGIAWSPDSRAVATYGEGAVRIHRRPGGGGQVIPLAQVRSVHWSPDGSRLAVVSGPPELGQQSIWLIEAASGVVSQLATQAYSPAWAPDGRSLAYVQDLPDGADQVRLWRPEGEPVSLMDGARIAALPGQAALFTQGRFTPYALTWSPTGDRVVVTAKDQGAAPRFMLVAAPVDGGALQIWPLPIYPELSHQGPVRVYPYTPCSVGAIVWVGGQLATRTDGPGCERRVALLDPQSLAVRAELEGHEQRRLLPSPDGAWLGLTAEGSHTFIPLGDRQNPLRLEVAGELVYWGMR